MYQFFVTLLQPYPLLFLAIAVALGLLWRRGASRRRLALLTLLVALLTAVQLPIVGDLAVGSLEWFYPPTYERPDEIQAIVVLCGYVRPASDFWPEPELGNDTLRRCLHAARMYGEGTGDRGQGAGGRGQGAGDRGQETGDRGQGAGDRGQETGDRRQSGRATDGQSYRTAEAQGGGAEEGQRGRAIEPQNDGAAEREEGVAPLVIVSGGTVPGTPGPSMARTMGEFLLTQGVAPEDLVLEDQALSGYENAVYCARLLRERQITRVLLVTSAVHMPRASAAFRAQGVDVTCAACDHLTGPLQLTPRSFWPNAQAAQKFQTAVREWMGLAWYWATGKVGR